MDAVTYWGITRLKAHIGAFLGWIILLRCCYTGCRAALCATAGRFMWCWLASAGNSCIHLLDMQVITQHNRYVYFSYCNEEVRFVHRRHTDVWGTLKYDRPVIIIYIMYIYTHSSPCVHTHPHPPTTHTHACAHTEHNHLLRASAASKLT